MKPKKILVCVDRSPDPVALVRSARAVAASFHASLTLLHGEGHDVDEILKGVPLLEWPEVLRYGGDAVEAVLELTGGAAADLVIIGNGAVADEQELSPSVARLLRHTGVPFLVVPTDCDLPAGGLVVRRILAPVDFSEVSVPGLRFAASYGKALGANLFLCTVVPLEHGVGLLTSQDDAASLPGLMAERMSSAERALEDLRQSADVEAHGLQVVGHDDVAEALAALAQSWHADLVCIPSLGKGLLARALLGSTAEKLVAKAQTPVLVVPRALLEKV